MPSPKQSSCGGTTKARRGRSVDSAFAERAETPSVGVGLLGFGAISQVYAAAIDQKRGLSLRGVADHDVGKLRAFRARGVPTGNNVNWMIELDGIDAVIVTLPNDAHVTVCEELLRAGKHVCCEKPLAFDVADAEHLVALAERQETVLLTAFHRRYNRNIRLLKQAIAGRRVVRLTAHYDEMIQDHCQNADWYLDPRRCGGGCIIDNGSNVFDAVSFLLGDFAIRDVSVVWDRGVDLRARLHATSGAGAVVEIGLDWAYPNGERKIVEVELDDGAVLVADMLAGFEGFKASLTHEYEGVLDEFLERIHGRRPAPGIAPPAGERTARHVAEAYRLAGRAAASGPV